MEMEERLGFLVETIWDLGFRNMDVLSIMDDILDLGASEEMMYMVIEMYGAVCTLN